MRVIIHDSVGKYNLAQLRALRFFIVSLLLVCVSPWTELLWCCISCCSNTNSMIVPVYRSKCLPIYLRACVSGAGEHSLFLTYTRTRTHTHTHPHIHTYTHTSTHTHTHTHAHTHTYTHTHTHMHRMFT